jgi:hypothetical protein
LIQINSTEYVDEWCNHWHMYNHGSQCQQDVSNMTQVQRYSDPATFRVMLTMLGVSEDASEILQADDITSLQVVVGIYQDDVDSFQSYLKGINKTYINRNPPVRFIPRVISRLTGVFHY